MFYLTPHSTSVWTIKSDLTNRGFQTFKELFWRRLMRLIFQPSLTFVWEQWNLKYLKQTRGTHKKIVGKAKLAIEQTRTDESPTLLSPPLFSSFLPWSLPWNNLIFSWCCRRILWTASINLPTREKGGFTVSSARKIFEKNFASVGLGHRQGEGGAYQEA